MEASGIEEEEIRLLEEEDRRQKKVCGQRKAIYSVHYARFVSVLFFDP